MSACARLFHANKIYAYFNATEKHVVILADVTLNPVADDVHICPNPIAMPASREFLVAGTTRSGIQPTLVLVRRLSHSFFSDATPKSVIVYSAGIDAPLRQEIPVASSPPPPLLGSTNGSTQAPEVKPPQGPVEVTGYSPTFSLEQAVEDALAKATAQFPAPPRNPDAAVEIDIKDIFARSGGNIRPGLFVRAIAK